MPPPSVKCSVHALPLGGGALSAGSAAGASTFALAGTGAGSTPGPGTAPARSAVEVQASAQSARNLSMTSPRMRRHDDSNERLQPELHDRNPSVPAIAAARERRYDAPWETYSTS